MNKLAVFFVVSVCVLQCTLAKVDKDKMMQLGKKCKEESQTTDEELTKMMNKEMPTTKEAKCMVSCIFKAMGLLTADGKYDEEGNAKAIQKAFEGNEEKIKQAKELAVGCKERVNAIEDDDSGCERAAEMHKCTMEKAEELGYTMEQ